VSQCEATTKKGRGCSNEALDGQRVCASHGGLTRRQANFAAIFTPNVIEQMNKDGAVAERKQMIKRSSTLAADFRALKPEPQEAQKLATILRSQAEALEVEPAELMGEEKA
jgi:hypothetical protein